MVSRLRLVAAILPLLALAACGGAPPNKGNAPLATAGTHPVPWHFDGEPKTGEETAALPLPAVPPGPMDEPARLKGLEGRQVKSVLGAPSFRRREAPAEIWQYRARTCTLDLFLYDEAGGIQTVAHWAVRSTSGVNDRDCFHDLLTKAKGTPVS